MQECPILFHYRPQSIYWSFVLCRAPETKKLKQVSVVQIPIVAKCVLVPDLTYLGREQGGKKTKTAIIHVPILLLQIKIMKNVKSCFTYEV